jgi:MFS family permease
VTTAAETGHAGVFQTFREMPVAARFVLLGVFVNQFGAFLQAFMVLYLVEGRGFSAQQAGIALGAYSVGAILGVLFGGGMSDRLGPRWTIVLSVGSAALLTLSVTALDALPTIVVAVALAGAMTQASRPAVTALLLGLVPPARQVMTFAMYRTALHTGIVAGPLVASYLSTINWDLVFYFDAASALTYAAIAIFLLRPDKAKPIETAQTKEAAQGKAQPKASYLQILRDTRYLAYLALMFVNGLVHIQFMAVLPLMLLVAGYPAWAYGTAAAVSAFLVITCELPVVKVTQKWAPWLAVIVGWMMLVVGRSAYGLPGGLTIILIASAIAAIGQSVGGAQAFAYPMKVAPSNAVGRYIGSAHALFQLGYAIGPVVGILLWNQIGQAFWVIVFVLGIVMVGPGIWGMRPVQGEPSEQREAETPDPAPTAAAEGPAEEPAEAPAAAPTATPTTAAPTAAKSTS